MDKSQAIHKFWNSFDIPAFDENSVPDERDRIATYGAAFPYIAYSVATDSLGGVVLLNASIWDRTTTWGPISQTAEKIAKALAEYGYYKLKLDTGYVWFVKGTPFAQRMRDQIDEQIKRIYLNVQAEFLTAY